MCAANGSVIVICHKYYDQRTRTESQAKVFMMNSWLYKTDKKFNEIIRVSPAEWETDKEERK